MLELLCQLIEYPSFELQVSHRADSVVVDAINGLVDYIVGCECVVDGILIDPWISRITVVPDSWSSFGCAPA